MTISLWNYHSNPNQLIGSDRIQLTSLMDYYGGVLDKDDFPDEVYKPEYQDKFLKQGLAKATTQDELTMAVFYATEISGERIPEIESKLLNSDDLTSIINYARDVLGSRWPELEQQIIDSQDIPSMLYYMDRLKKRAWPELAQKILDLPDSTPDLLKTKNKHIISYAAKTKKRWPEAEPSILRQGYSTLRYIQYVINAPWPEGEYVLAKSGYAQTYLADYPQRWAEMKKLGYSQY